MEWSWLTRDINVLLLVSRSSENAWLMFCQWSDLASEPHSDTDFQLPVRTIWRTLHDLRWLRSKSMTCTRILHRGKLRSSSQDRFLGRTWWTSFRCGSQVHRSRCYPSSQTPEACSCVTLQEQWNCCTRPRHVTAAGIPAAVTCLQLKPQLVVRAHRQLTEQFVSNPVVAIRGGDAGSTSTKDGRTEGPGDAGWTQGGWTAQESGQRRRGTKEFGATTQQQQRRATADVSHTHAHAPPSSLYSMSRKKCY